MYHTKRGRRLLRRILARRYWEAAHLSCTLMAQCHGSIDLSQKHMDSMVFIAMQKKYKEAICQK